jgi:hypothetical protein
VVCILGAVAVAVVLSDWPAVIVLPLSLPVLHGVLTKDGAALNPLLGRTALLLLAYSVLFSIGWVL